MGCLISPVEEIDSIRWVRLTGRAQKARAVAIIPNGGQHDLMIVALENGSFACSRDLSKFAYMPGEYPWMDGVIKALVKLGAITQAAADRHMAACAKNAKRSADRYRAEALARIAEEAGIALSADQAAFVAEHSRQQRAA